MIGPVAPPSPPCAGRIETAQSGTMCSGAALEITEMRRGWLRRRYALWVVIFCPDGLAFVGPWREARERIDAWVRRRGHRCRFAVLRVVCNPDVYPSVEKVLR